ncbi:MAG: hypothetical protein Ct9H90mP27_2160 [Gammaproteobacteria bacterium]|nr:MAG: hypothetical protein Ct9H90mP27_2160 [Gammaproteobacteria bacterium]
MPLLYRRICNQKAVIILVPTHQTLFGSKEVCGVRAEVKSGFEYEFFVFSETPHSIRQKNYTDLTPLTPGNFGYSS